MKRIGVVLFIVLLAILSACGQKESAPTWQEQYDLGVRYLSEGNYEEAIIAFTAAIEIDPKQASAYLGRAGAYISSGETGDNLTFALADYEEAVKLDETSSFAWLGLADVYVLQGDYEKAMEVLKNALTRTNNHSSIAERITEIKEMVAETQPQTSVEEHRFQSQVTADGMNVNAANLTVQVRNSRTATITIGGLSLQDSYLTDLSTSEENAAEYHWCVEMHGEQEAYSVSTSWWAFEPGAEVTKAITDMQHSVWAYDGDSWPYIGEAAMSYTADSITWTFTVPEEYPFNFAKVNRYEVQIEDISQNLNQHRTYTLK